MTRTSSRTTASPVARRPAGTEASDRRGADAPGRRRERSQRVGRVTNTDIVSSSRSLPEWLGSGSRALVCVSVNVAKRSRASADSMTPRLVRLKRGRQRAPLLCAAEGYSRGAGRDAACSLALTLHAGAHRELSRKDKSSQQAHRHLESARRKEGARGGTDSQPSQPPVCPGDTRSAASCSSQARLS